MSARHIIGTIIMILILFRSTFVLSYEGKVHSLINENAVNSSQLHDVLLNRLGINDGISAPLSIEKRTKQAKYWIAYGGEAEDLGKWNIEIDPTTRAYNHFHDPLKDWTSAGLDNTFLDYMYSYIYNRSPVSLLLWGMEPESQNFVENKRGDWSWEKAKDYYFGYLTGRDNLNNIVLYTQRDREQYLAGSLIALGQVMHLLQDCSVPLHTRNDVHILPFFYSGQLIYGTYETYTKKNMEFLSYTPNQPGNHPDPLLIKDPNPDPNYTHLAPITGLFDRNKYNSGDPIPAANAPVGLAEYSNANFLTQDTMWKYPHPALSDTNYDESIWLDPEAVEAEDGQIDNRIYLKKVTGDPVDHLVAAGYWFYQLYMWNKPELHYAFILDEKCFSDYASKLVPRAVGYSAELLDYFFRGTIEISDFDLAVDYPQGHHATSVGFNKVTIHAKNTSPPGETMTGGSVHLVVRYKVDEKDGYLNLPVNPDEDFKYIVKLFDDGPDQPLHEIPDNDSSQFDFDLTDKPIPLCAKDISFYLVYRGQLGLESDGIGVGYMPFTEFRTVNISLSDSGVYALSDLEPKDINPAAEGFDAFSLSAENIDPYGFSMTAGTIRVIIKYRPASADQFRNSPPGTSVGFHYIVKDLPSIQSIPKVPSESSDPTQFTLDLSDAQIPLWATDVYLYVIYRGQIGEEPCRTAVGFKDISEPTPIAYYNCMDKVCIYGNMLDAGDEALDVAVFYGMQDEWDVYPHDRSDVYIRYSSLENPQSYSSGSIYNYKIPYQAAGEFKILYVLSDYHFAINNTSGYHVLTDSRDVFNHSENNTIWPVFPFQSIRNQIEAAAPGSPHYNPEQTSYIRYIPVFGPFRDIENNWMSISLGKPSLPEDHPDNVNCQY